MKTFSEISRRLNSFIEKFERKQRKSDFIESLRAIGFEGTDDEIISTYRWLCLPRGAKEEPKQEPVDEDDLLFDDEEERGNSIKIERW